MCKFSKIDITANNSNLQSTKEKESKNISRALSPSVKTNISE